jgi:starch phosphorylase
MNIAGVGNFSSDRSIKDYCTNIWDIKPVPMDKKILEDMRAIFVANDKCTIDPNIFKDVKD